MPWLERMLFVYETCAEVGLNKFTSSTLFSNHSFFNPVYFQAVHISANFSWGQRTGKLGENWRTCFKKRRNGKTWKKYYKKVETTSNGTERNSCPNRCNLAQSIWPNFVIPQSFQRIATFVSVTRPLNCRRQSKWWNTQNWLSLQPRVKICRELDTNWADSIPSRDQRRWKPFTVNSILIKMVRWRVFLSIVIVWSKSFLFTD